MQLEKLFPDQFLTAAQILNIGRHHTGQGEHHTAERQYLGNTGCGIAAKARVIAVIDDTVAGAYVLKNVIVEVLQGSQLSVNGRYGPNGARSSDITDGIGAMRANTLFYCGP